MMMIMKIIMIMMIMNIIHDDDDGSSDGYDENDYVIIDNMRHTQWHRKACQEALQIEERE